MPRTCLGLSFKGRARQALQALEGRAAGFPAVSAAPLEVSRGQVLLGPPLGADANVSEKDLRTSCTRRTCGEGWRTPAAGPGTRLASFVSFNAGREVMGKRDTFPGDGRVVSANSGGTATGHSFPSQCDAGRCHFAAVRAERQLVAAEVAENGECFNPPLPHTPPRERRAFTCPLRFSEGSSASGPGTRLGRRIGHSCRGRTRARRGCGTREGS